MPKLFRQLVDTTASAQAWLHELDAAPLVEDLADLPTGVERWFERLAAFEGLADGLDWLVSRRPPDVARSVVCHGDLHPGNILTDGNRLTGVLDYTVVTIAEPALDVGYTAMGFDLTPIDAPRPDPTHRHAFRPGHQSPLRGRVRREVGFRRLQPAVLRGTSVRG